MAKSAKMDPLEAAKITEERAAADKAALGVTMHVDPRNPQPLPEAPEPVADGQCVMPPKAAEPELRADGPTLEEWLAAEYDAANYPPHGYAEKPSAALTRHKAGGPIPREWIDAARDKMRAAELGASAPVSPSKTFYVVLEDRRANVGHGQIALFRKGQKLALAGYGERGINRLLVSGLKLKKIEE